MPPSARNNAGEPRRVGFEIEYLGLDLAPTARLILEALGESSGTDRIRFHHKNSCEVRTDRFGIFKVKVDVELLQKLAESSERNLEADEFDVEGAVEELIGPVITAFAPNEIVTPPIPMTDMAELEPLVDLMRLNGAEGTDVSIGYAFGLHINPEAPSFASENILAHIQAFLLLYDWLQEEMRMKFSRKVTAYAGGFPRAYVRHVLVPDYKPNLPALIDDYLTYNPTRNRALDLLPLFTHLDERRVRSVVRDNRVRQRPTYHFRLPNCRIDDPSWQLMVEWNRWVMVEMLAADEALRRRMIRHRQLLREKLLGDFSAEWLIASRNYVEQMR